VGCDGCLSGGNNQCIQCSSLYSVDTSTDSCILCDKTRIGYHKGGKGHECADLFDYMCMNLITTLDKDKFINESSPKTKSPSYTFMLNSTDLLVIY